MLLPPLDQDKISEVSKCQWWSVFWDIHATSRLSLDKWCSRQFLRVGNTGLVTEQTFVSPRPGWKKSNLCNYMFSLYSALALFYLSCLEPEGAEWYCTSRMSWSPNLQCMSIPFSYGSTLQTNLSLFLKQRCHAINFWSLKNFKTVFWGKTNAGANDLCR